MSTLCGIWLNVIRETMPRTTFFRAYRFIQPRTTNKNAVSKGKIVATKDTPDPQYGICSSSSILKINRLFNNDFDKILDYIEQWITQIRSIQTISYVPEIQTAETRCKSWGPKVTKISKSGTYGWIAGSKSIFTCISDKRFPPKEGRS